jgi:hypothetical protein
MWRGTVFDQWQHTFREVVEEQGLEEIRSQSRADDVPVHRSDALHEGDRYALISELESDVTVESDEPASPGSPSAETSTDAASAKTQPTQGASDGADSHASSSGSA